MIRRALAALAVVAAMGGAAAAQSPDPDGGVLPSPAAPDAGAIIIDGPGLSDVARPQASASASPSQLQLGETLTLFVEVVYDQRVTVNLPSTLDLSGSFDELRRTSRDEVRTDGTRKRVYQIELRAWELGDLTLPPIQVGYSAGSERSWVVTNPVPLRVLGLLGDVDDKTALIGDTPPMSLQTRDWRPLIIAASAAAALAIALVAWRLRKRKPQPELILGPAAPVKVVRVRLSGAAERALAALTALERAGTLVSEPREGYEQLVGILRTFWSEQFAVGIRDRTSGELMRALAKTGMPGEAREASGRWLDRCDLVKYAKVEPEAEVSAGDLAAGRELVYAAVSAAESRVATRSTAPSPSVSTTTSTSTGESTSPSQSTSTSTGES